ncbi:MAG: hypothetical protein PHO18_06605 [Synergistaceae bacterium]|nr:hypothetical protein [Synergistaceae bacterium]
MLIVVIGAGSVSCLFPCNKNCDSLIREEAENLAFWLSDRMARAQAEECAFKLSMSQQGTKNTLFRLTWQGGTQHGEKETYQSSEVRIFPVTGDLSKVRVFDGGWSSMTPAVTLDVKPKPSCDGKTLYVVVSGSGYVTIRDKIK